MILKKCIPKDFYRLFRTGNMDAYMELLVAVYEENSEVYAASGLTREECTAVIRETMEKSGTVWQKEDGDGNYGGKEFAARDADPDSYARTVSDIRETAAQKELKRSTDNVPASAILGRLIDWGWLNSDYDERLNSYVITFPEYSQLYVELFRKLQSEDDSRERESILSIYSALYTFHKDEEKNNGILRNALYTSQRLGQLLSNMQDGMRGYFDKLSGRKNFIGIQEVLVEEINNSDSKKYAILTTTDSFYRYKEAVRELISQILSEHDLCRETTALVCSIEREFDRIERKYNKLIEQKTVFAKRALARVRYIMKEGTNENDDLIRLLHLLDRHPRREEILDELRSGMHFWASCEIMTDGSFYRKREKNERDFRPVFSVPPAEDGTEQLIDYIPKPLYTKKQLREFREKHTYDGRFTATAQTVRSVEDLEKLMFLWQEETEIRADSDRIIPGEEIETDQGFRFSGFSIEEG